LLFALTTFLTLISTYLWGYHSLRQILYGTILAVVFHAAFVDLANYTDSFLEHPSVSSFFSLFLFFFHLVFVVHSSALISS
jgi:hypothetical protein